MIENTHGSQVYKSGAKVLLTHVERQEDEEEEEVKMMSSKLACAVQEREKRR